VSRTESLPHFEFVAEKMIGDGGGRPSVS